MVVHRSQQVWGKHWPLKPHDPTGSSSPPGGSHGDAPPLSHKQTRKAHAQTHPCSHCLFSAALQINERHHCRHHQHLSIRTDNRLLLRDTIILFYYKKKCYVLVLNIYTFVEFFFKYPKTSYSNILKHTFKFLQSRKKKKTQTDFRCNQQHQILKCENSDPANLEEGSVKHWMF